MRSPDCTMRGPAGPKRRGDQVRYTKRCVWTIAQSHGAPKPRLTCTSTDQLVQILRVANTTVYTQNMGWREDWSAVTPMLILAVVAFSWGDLLFGIDTGSFGALQVLPSWLRDFGQYDAATDTYISPIERRSLMNSIVL